MTLIVDINEPYEEALRLLTPVLPCIVEPLNVNGFADYKWTAHDGGVVQVERKTWPELLGDMDKVEDQLRRHKSNQPEARLIFLFEGIAVPMLGGTTTLKSTNKDRVYVAGYGSSIRMTQIYSWLYSVSQYLEVYQTPNYQASCLALSSFYKSDQKEVHGTFTRHFKQIAFNPNPQVVQLMGMTPGIGEKRAMDLIERFTTIYNVLTASPQELAKVPGIGSKLSVQILRNAGRPDV